MVYHGYYVLISTFLLNFCAIGVFNSAGLYLEPLSITFPSAGSGTLALYCTIQIVTGLSSSLVGGVLQDVLDKREIKLLWLFFVGGIFMMVGFFVSSIAYTLIGVLVGSFLMGIGLGLGGFMAGGICVLWFEAARGTMLLLAMSGQGLGNVFFAWATAQLLEKYDYIDDPWRPTMRCIGVLSFALCAIASISMRLPLPGEVDQYEKGTSDSNAETLEEGDKESYYGTLDSASRLKNSTTQPAQQKTDITKLLEERSPEKNNIKQRRRRSSAIALEQMRNATGHTRQSIIKREARRRSTKLGSFQAIGQTPLLQLSDFQSDGDDGTTNLRAQLSRLSFAGIANESLRSLLGEGLDDYEFSLGEVTLSSTNVWLNAFTLVACFPFLVMQILLPGYMSSLGMSSQMAGHALVIFGVGDFLSNLTLGAVADTVGARRLFTIAFYSLSLLFFLWPHCTTVSTLSAIAFFYGYFCCTVSSMPIIILADAYGDDASGHILALNGITNMFKFPGYLFGPPIAGMLVEISGYNLAALVSGVCTLIGTTFLLFIPHPKEQKRQLSTIPERSIRSSMGSSDSSRSRG